jgi:phosphatidylserine/phosphatidylglycerophosphate/cardiolipin synthase-like enzyme
MADRVITAPEDRRTAVLQVIREAKRTILLSLFRCTDEGIFEELAAATARGVSVEALVTARAKGGRKKLAKLYRSLKDARVSVSMYSDPVVKYHAKYLVADDGPAVVASLNFTKKCFSRTLDALVITDDPAVVDGLRRLMNADRESQPVHESLTPRLIIGPESARRQLIGLIMRAQRTIRLVDAKLSDPEVLMLLKQRRREGITVEIFNMKRLGDLKSHGKILLIDDAIAVVGSLSLAALSLDFRREVAITVEQPSAVGEIVRLFESIGETAPSGSPDGIDPKGAALC